MVIRRLYLFVMIFLDGIMRALFMKSIALILLMSIVVNAIGCSDGTEEVSVNRIGIKLVSIPSGTFQMGDLSGDGYSGERPVHSVTLSPFSMSKYEITYAQWVEIRRWAEKNGYSDIDPGHMGSEGYNPNKWRSVAELKNTATPTTTPDQGTQDENCPVTGINWYDVVLWCNALSEMEGRTPCYYTSSTKTMVYRNGRIEMQNDCVDWSANGYRLPTEAEWEYACRAGTTTKYSFGNNISQSDANYSGNEGGTVPVGSYSPNIWELYDLHGNVWEWCWDWYGEYSDNRTSNPRGPSKGSFRVLRGGNWNDLADRLRSANRIKNHPRNTQSYIVGFRPVCSQ